MVGTVRDVADRRRERNLVGTDPMVATFHLHHLIAGNTVFRPGPPIRLRVPRTVQSHEGMSVDIVRIARRDGGLSLERESSMTGERNLKGFVDAGPVLDASIPREYRLPNTQPVWPRPLPPEAAAILASIVKASGVSFDGSPDIKRADLQAWSAVQPEEFAAYNASIALHRLRGTWVDNARSHGFALPAEDGKGLRLITVVDDGEDAGQRYVDVVGGTLRSSPDGLIIDDDFPVRMGLLEARRKLTPLFPLTDGLPVGVPLAPVMTARIEAFVNQHVALDAAALGLGARRGAEPGLF